MNEMNDLFFLTEAVSNLVPQGTKWSVRGSNIPDDIWFDNESDRPTQTKINNEVKRLKEEQQAETEAE